VLFNDSQSAKKILEASDPWTHKRLGRLVQGFDFKVWQKHCHRVVYQANYAKVIIMDIYIYMYTYIVTYDQQSLCNNVCFNINYIFI
jgi:predicted NAD-dependent protein-ADP-ribosyltransferase YbiA (DUF1768 family)